MRHLSDVIKNTMVELTALLVALFVGMSLVLAATPVLAKSGDIGANEKVKVEKAKVDIKAEENKGPKEVVMAMEPKSSSDAKLNRVKDLGIGGINGLGLGLGLRGLLGEGLLEGIGD